MVYVMSISPETACLKINLAEIKIKILVILRIDVIANLGIDNWSRNLFRDIFCFHDEYFY